MTTPLLGSFNMRHAALALALALAPTLCACIEAEDDPRLDLVELSCDDTGSCLGRWDGTDLWSPVILADRLSDFPEVDGSVLWDCIDEVPDPDYVVCVEIDSHQRVGCFRDEDDFAVPVAPTCAVEDLEGWIDVGVGMSALAKTRGGWAD